MGLLCLPLIQQKVRTAKDSKNRLCLILQTELQALPKIHQGSSSSVLLILGQGR